MDSNVAVSASASNHQTTPDDIHKLAEYNQLRTEQSEIARDICSTMTSIRKQAEVFARNHPTFAKYSGYVLKGIGTVAITSALISAAEVGGIAILATGGSILATDKLIATVIEKGTESLVEYTASQGRNDTEAREFADTTVWAIEMILTGAATVGITKCIKNGGAILNNLRNIKGNLGNIVRNVRFNNSGKLSIPSAKNITDIVEYSPYLRREIEKLAIISESETIAKAAQMRGEWNGQFKLIRAIPETVTGTEFASKVYSREVLFKDPKTGQMFRAFQRNDIDPNYVVRNGPDTGKTNISLLIKGKAPYTNTGEKVQIHHMGQSAYGPFVELTKTTHKPCFHNQFGYTNGHPTNPVIRSKFDPIREAYWRAYAESFK